jgi:hypothetical protein
MHYLVLPIWWDGQTPQTPASVSTINSVLNQTVQYYKDMSWNRHTMSYQILDQIVLPNVTGDNAGFDNSAAAVRYHVATMLNQTAFGDYQGLVCMYKQANVYPLSNTGGWGSVNGNSPFTHMVLPGDFAVTRYVRTVLEQQRQDSKKASHTAQNLGA